MRLHEAILADLPRLKYEAEQYGKINIQDGTKGSRSGASAPRWIKVDKHIHEAVKYAEQVSSDGSRNLLAPNEAISINNSESSALPGAFSKCTASKASTNYEQPMRANAMSRSLTLAPINGSNCYQPDRRLDQNVRTQISHELGHGRVDVVSAYIGGRDKP